MANLTVTKETGELLFDTNLICYGLIKSGYMVYLSNWTRRTLRSAQLDPNNGANWFPSTEMNGGAPESDPMHGFTVYNTRSPIVFITGSGCLQGTVVSGATITFYYANADTNTKFYCFDLMRDDIPGGPFLKTYTPSGVITFNSLQRPLNVVGAIQAPIPSGLNSFGRYITAYAGGYNVVRASASALTASRVDSRIDIALAAGIEYAAYLPWSRTCAIWDSMSSSGNLWVYGGAEGAFGRVGGMSFMIGASGGTTLERPAGQLNPGGSASFGNLPTDRYPIALMIQITVLPFPFG